MNYPGDLADPKDVAAWMSHVASTEYALPGILPVMTSAVELTDAWTSSGDVKQVVGYLWPVDGCSVGYFQQQADDLGCGYFGWGTREQCIDADYALRAFCKEAVKYKGQYREADPDELGQWCQAVQRSAYPDAYRDKGYPLAKALLSESQQGGGMVTGADIVKSARKLLGAPYRIWNLGDSIPMWLDDGRGDPPPVSHLQSVGVECSDLVNFALEDNGLLAGGGTESFADYLINTSPFDPNSPGEPGAIAFTPYVGPDLSQQGHIAIFVDKHTLVQALFRDGVTDAYTDAETYGWGGSTAFSVYGFLPGVAYQDDAPAPVVDKEFWRQFGWYEAINAQWDLKWHAPEKG